MRRFRFSQGSPLVQTEGVVFSDGSVSIRQLGGGAYAWCPSWDDMKHLDLSPGPGTAIEWLDA